MVSWFLRIYTFYLPHVILQKTEKKYIISADVSRGDAADYSTFYVIRHQLATYGAMGYSKEAIEKWTVESGKSHHSCIRAGLFESQSSRGIKLLLRKSAKNTENLKDINQGIMSQDSTEDEKDEENEADDREEVERGYSRTEGLF